MNPAALAKAICALLEDDNLRKKFGETNYKIAKKRASWDDNVKVLEGMYQSLAKH
jgi:glycosyltransferase involved in cell wall biosynthesis